MAIRYLRSTDGSDADGGTTWALAKATLAGIDAIDTAGDTIWVSQVHNESTAGALVIGLAGTAASPTKLLCGNDGAEPPTALATTGAISTTGANSITVNGTNSYAYGLNLSAGSGAVTANITLGGGRWESCSFTCAGSSGGQILFGATSYVDLLNCTFKFSNIAGLFGASSSLAKVAIRGGSFAAGTTTPTALFSPPSVGITVDGLDFSNLSSTVNMSASLNGNLTIRNSKMPAAWSGSLCSGTPASGMVAEMINCDSGDTHYRYRRASQYGTAQDETTIVNSAGASDGVTTYSLKTVSNANAKHPLWTMNLPDAAVWNDTVGTPVTITVDFVHDSVTALKDNEIWMDATYLGTSGVPLGSLATEGVSVVAAGASQDASTATWVTTGMANPNKQKLVLTVTPQEAGFIYCTVRLAKASYTVYVDNNPVLS